MTKWFWCRYCIYWTESIMVIMKTIIQDLLRIDNYMRKKNTPFNILNLRKYDRNFKCAIFYYHASIVILSISWDIRLMYMPKVLFNRTSTLISAMGSKSVFWAYMCRYAKQSSVDNECSNTQRQLWLLFDTG